MRFDSLKRYTPPGMEFRSELACLGIGIGCSFFYSFTFLVRYFQNFEDLFDPYVSGKLREGALMEDFHLILGLHSIKENILIGFFITAILMLAFIPFHYAYYSQGSKSIYLMKRLPKRTELHKRSLVLPISAAICCLICAIITMLLYFVIYMLATPEACLQASQWDKLWGTIL